MEQALAFIKADKQSQIGLVVALLAGATWFFLGDHNKQPPRPTSYAQAALDFTGFAPANRSMIRPSFGGGELQQRGPLSAPRVPEGPRPSGTIDQLYERAK